MADLVRAFGAAIRAAGLEPPDTIEPGRIHRFPGLGKGRSNRAAWCLLFADCRGGAFGDWSSGLSRAWWSESGRPQVRVGLARHHATTDAKRCANAGDRRALEGLAASRAEAIWRDASAAPSDHPYLRRKSIEAHGARLYKGLLTLPVTDFSGRLTSLQFIAADGNKRLLTGGRKRGCFIPVDGLMEPPTRAVICEGWATGCTLAEDSPHSTVLAAVDAGNLLPVALSARLRWPSAELVVAGDDDRLTPGNPGATKARAAAVVAGALLALPAWPEGAPPGLTDFNDLAAWLSGGRR